MDDKRREPDPRRVGWPTLLMLLAFLGASSLMLYEAVEGRAMPERERPRVFDDDPIGADTYRRYEWGPQIPTSSGEGDGPDPTNLDRFYDPQRTAMEESFGRQSDGGPTSLPFPMAVFRAHIVEAEGAVPVEMDAACDVRVLPVAHGEFNCLVRVRCAGHILYPNPSQTAGFGHCEVSGGRVREVRDLQTSGMDGDPRVSIEGDDGRVIVSDAGDRAEPFRMVLERTDPQED